MTSETDSTSAAQTEDAGAYRVLARKYRPSRFEDLIGQEPMVRTLRNAFAAGRIAQAYMLTGVRGVGKTTTARILARALNYVPANDGDDAGPTLDMPEPGRHCIPILESRHVDVMEMDAASHTSVDNIRDIIDSVQYRPLEARYKVYIIDEVHMLSKPAFNALLKTLEEPPPHVKFIFATTEIRKVPITVLSRCQRFDLRRIEADVLIAHLRGIAEKENVSADDEALAMIARAAEGSVRDALSILDQAIAHCDGKLETPELRDMLGVADRARVADLFGALMRGAMEEALEIADRLHGDGAEPATVLTDLASFSHLVTRMKAVPGVSADSSLSEDERTRGAGFAQELTMGALNRGWQVLVRGIEEVQSSAQPRAAADMVLIRLAHASGLPDPEEAASILRDGAASAGTSPQANATGGGRPSAGPASHIAAVTTATGASAPRSFAGDRRAATARMPDPDEQPAEPASAPAAPVIRIEHFEDIAKLASERRDPLLKSNIEKFVRLVRLDPPTIEFALEEGAPMGLVQEIGTRLSEWTGERWIAILSRETGDLPLRAQRAHAKQAELEDVRRDPLVRAVMEAFPDAKVEGVKVIATAANASAVTSDEDYFEGGNLPVDPDEDQDEEFF